jgi:uncharacterized cupin superfamily protein
MGGLCRYAGDQARSGQKEAGRRCGKKTFGIWAAAVSNFRLQIEKFLCAGAQPLFKKMLLT